jgi:hypothetical protein
MKPSKFGSSAIALIVAGLLVIGVGTYTDNGGFQLAGALFLLVAVVLALARGRRSDA